MTQLTCCLPLLPSCGTSMQDSMSLLTGCNDQVLRVFDVEHRAGQHTHTHTRTCTHAHTHTHTHTHTHFHPFYSVSFPSLLSSIPSVPPVPPSLSPVSEELKGHTSAIKVALWGKEDNTVLSSAEDNEIWYALGLSIRLMPSLSRPGLVGTSISGVSTWPNMDRAGG